MKDALKEELKAETERFKTFAFLLVASVSGTTALFLSQNLDANLKIQVLFVLGFISVLGFAYLCISSHLKIDIIIDSFKHLDHDI
jgi:hypothetical protein